MLQNFLTVFLFALVACTRANQSVSTILDGVSTQTPTVTPTVTPAVTGIPTVTFIPTPALSPTTNPTVTSSPTPHSTVSGTATPTPTSTPEALTVTGFTGVTAVTPIVGTGLTISWSAATSGNIDRYSIYLATSSGTQNFSAAYKTVQGAGSTSTTIRGLAENTTYFVVVRASDGSAHDNNTAEMSAATFVLDATDLKLWLASDRGIEKNDTVAHFQSAQNEFLSVNDNADLSAGDVNFTIATWVYFDTHTGQVDLVGKYGDEYVLQSNSPSTGFTFSVKDSSGNLSQVSKALTLETERWYFVVASHDATNDIISISVDNGAPTTAAHTTGVHDGTASFRLGSSESGNNLNGRMAKTGFWKGAVLSSSEINEIYNNGIGLRYDSLSNGVKTHLVSYWNLSDAADLTRTDSHGTNNLTDNNTVGVSSGPSMHVSRWLDQSGNGAHATQTVDAKKPLYVTDGDTPFNNKAYLKFDGVDDFLQGIPPPHSELTLFFVYKNNDGVKNWAGIMTWGASVGNDYSNVNAWQFANYSTDGQGLFTRSVGTDHMYLLVTLPTDLAIQTFQFGAGAAEIFTNSTSAVTDTYDELSTITPSIYTISDRVWAGAAGGNVGENDFAEIIAYDKKLSSTKRNEVECYLAYKYAIDVSVGVTCP